MRVVGVLAVVCLRLCSIQTQRRSWMKTLRTSHPLAGCSRSFSVRVQCVSRALCVCSYRLFPHSVRGVQLLICGHPVAVQVSSEAWPHSCKVAQGKINCLLLLLHTLIGVPHDITDCNRRLCIPVTPTSHRARKFLSVCVCVCAATRPRRRCAVD